MESHWCGLFSGHRPVIMFLHSNETRFFGRISNTFDEISYRPLMTTFVRFILGDGAAIRFRTSRLIANSLIRPEIAGARSTVKSIITGIAVYNVDHFGIICFHTSFRVGSLSLEIRSCRVQGRNSTDFCARSVVYSFADATANVTS